MRTAELTGQALDWAVAQAEGQDYWQPDIGPSEPDYSTRWDIGGPIIEREEMTVSCNWQRPYAIKLLPEEKRVVQGNGPTPLIAAMRCYVAYKLGEEVDVPEELK